MLCLYLNKAARKSLETTALSWRVGKLSGGTLRERIYIYLEKQELVRHCNHGKSCVMNLRDDDIF